MRELLRRAEGLFRRDKEDYLRAQQEGSLALLEQRLHTFNEELESFEELGQDVPEDMMATYEALLQEIDAIRHQHKTLEGDDISPEWTALQDALNKRTPKQTPNLRLVIDAIERLKAEGEWDDSLEHDQTKAQEAA